MTGFLSAHGYDPGPTQRPALAGLLSGAAATIPATALLHGFGALEVEAEIVGRSIAVTLAAGCAIMALAGASYGRLFRRAANDRRGGWLIGAAYGFALWAAGAVMILPLVSGGTAPAGMAAIGVYLSLVLWGAAMGWLFPRVHRPLHKSTDATASGLGPAAAANQERLRQSKRRNGSRLR
ncbi:MAG TPA: hypothetical protein VFZ91_03065 [Allosphingosinicella sp.]